MNLPGRRRRVVMAIASDDVDLPSVERLTRLAESLDADFEAVFVEDMDVLGLADLPFLREYRFASRTMETMQLERLEGELRAAARRVEQALAQLAALRRVPWHFRVWRGSLEGELVGALPADVLALSQPGLLPGIGRRAIAPATEESIAVWVDDSASSDAALTTAARVAIAGGLRLVILRGGNAAPDERLLEQVGRITAGDALPVSMAPVPDASPAAVARVLHAHSSAALVLPRAAALLNLGSLRGLLHDLGCALLVVR